MSRISDIFSLKKISDADVGIEIEVEAQLHLPQLFLGDNNQYWSTHGDGSLRGISAEYVSKPIPRKDIVPALDFLALATKASKVKNSVRAGVHVHVNCQEMTEEELINYIALYTIFEVPLVNFCGDNRIGNAFCLRMCDAEGAIDIINSFMRRGVGHTTLDDNLRYGALNPISLRKYGTLEFRSLGTLYPFDNVKTWCEVLLTLKEKSKQFKTLGDITAAFETVGPKQFAKDMFGDLYKTFFPNFFDHDILVGFSYIRELTYFQGKI